MKKSDRKKIDEMVDNATVIEVYAYECLQCSHVNYFEVGGGRDIICHGCLTYAMCYKGKKFVAHKELERALNPK